jgi:hypothetical protein
VSSRRGYGSLELGGGAGGGIGEGAAISTDANVHQTLINFSQEYNAIESVLSSVESYIKSLKP